MSPVRRSSRISVQPSPYNAGVTLFKLEEDVASLALQTPNVSPRKRAQRRGVVKEEEEMDPVKLEGLLKIEYEEEEEDYKMDEDSADEDFGAKRRSPSKKRTRTPSKSPKKPPASPRKRKSALGPPSSELEPPSKPREPENWRVVFGAIRAMRQKQEAPVDTMGCHMAQRHEADPKNKRFITLVSLMLSAQAKDVKLDPIIAHLRQVIGGTMSLEAMLAADEADIRNAIQPLGLHKIKAANLKRMAIDLRDRFGGDVPKTLKEITSIKGVGPKVGILALHTAWDVNAGIGVDTHVLRITGPDVLGWHKFKKKDAERARQSLESWLPKDLNREINPMVVGFGQIICDAKKTMCAQCTLSTKGEDGKTLCPRPNIKSPPEIKW
ncbi:ENDO3c domain-containing protein [Mycena kentingensis (nom. inval.)]|nr:ENDO3c domain-containing protein [Mycena kentingensis (nom. inval.)]